MRNTQHTAANDSLMGWVSAWEAVHGCLVHKGSSPHAQASAKAGKREVVELNARNHAENSSDVEQKTSDAAVHGSGLLSNRGQILVTDLVFCERDNAAIPSGRDADFTGHSLRNNRGRFFEMGGECGLSPGDRCAPFFEFHASRLANAQPSVKRLLILFSVGCGHE